MLSLVALTDPGPFRARTIQLGNYLGLRQAGELIAMAGERYHLPGYVEISAVCTHPDHRGRGLATRLIRAVVAGIEQRGEQAFLHTGATNLTAIRLYESLGFTISNRMKVTLLQVV
jgi:predicted GNAT family acetyltransferase